VAGDDLAEEFSLRQGCSSGSEYSVTCVVTTVLPGRLSLVAGRRSRLPQREGKGSLDQTDDCSQQKPFGQAETFSVSEYFTPGFLEQRASSASRRSAK
jgi:hypothetical protein